MSPSRDADTSPVHTSPTGRFFADDPALGIDLAGDQAARDAIGRLLRHTPLSVLLRSRASLIASLIAMPEIHAGLRSSWERQDRDLAARVFEWVERARLHRTRTTGPRPVSRSWMAEGELVRTPIAA